jgi:hypothetical protein
MVAAVQSAVRALFADEAKAAGVTPAAPAAPSPGPGAQAAPMPTPVVTYSALPYRRWILGGRLAFATPGGDFDTDVKQSDYIGGQGVFQLEGLYRLTERVGLGGYLSYGAGQPGDFFKDGCDQGLTCSISVVRLGVDVTYEFADPRAKVVPWVGAGLGFEVYDLSIEDDVGGKITASANGFEPLHLQAGIDARFGGQIRLGAFGMFGIARYSSGEVDFTDIGLGSGSGKMDGTTHSYGTFGLRAAVEL